MLRRLIERLCCEVGRDREGRRVVMLLMGIRVGHDHNVEPPG